MEFTKEDAYIASIYKKALVQRSQGEKRREAEALKDLEDNFWAYLHGRLKMLIMNVMKLHDMPNVPKAQIDEAARGVSDLMTLVSMYTMPEVIIQLTADLTKERILEKLKR